MDIIPEQYINLLLQVPLVGVFIYFTLRLISIFNTTLEKRDIAWQTSIEKSDLAWQSVIEKRDQEWRLFLAEQRTTSTATILALGDRFGNEIKGVGEKVSTMHGMLLTHDARTRERSGKEGTA